MTVYDDSSLRSAINQIEQQLSGRQLSVALNKGARAARETFIRTFADEINLTRAEIESVYGLNQANPGSLVAEVKGRRRDIQLRRYGAQQEFDGSGKAAGVSVQVKPGAGRKTIRKAFYLKLRRGRVSGGNGEGVFVRTGGKLKLLYAPAPYQSFTRVAPQAIEAAEDILLNEVGGALQRITFEVQR